MVLVSLAFLSCSVRPVIKPQVTRGEYLKVVGKGVLYLRVFDEKLMKIGRMDANSLNQAEALFSLARDLRPEDPEAVDGLGSIHLRKGDLQTARVLFQEGLRLDPTYSRGYINLAYLEELEGRKGVSKQLLKSAINSSPIDVHALNNLGGIMFDEHLDPQEKSNGRKLLIQAIELGDKNSLVLKHNKKLVFD